jgi:CheY-like chemotaxis protein
MDSSNNPGAHQNLHGGWTGHDHQNLSAAHARRRRQHHGSRTQPSTAHNIAAETILIVEDSEDVRALTKESLRELGYHTFEAGAGQAALQILQEHSEIQLLLTDVGLPGGMNGRQLADEARRRRSNLKVLLATGYARNAIVHDDRLGPGVQLITKPYTFEALASKLRDP